MGSIPNSRKVVECKAKRRRCFVNGFPWPHRPAWHELCSSALAGEWHCSVQKPMRLVYNSVSVAPPPASRAPADARAFSVLVRSVLCARHPRDSTLRECCCERCFTCFYCLNTDIWENRDFSALLGRDSRTGDVNTFCYMPFVKMHRNSGGGVGRERKDQVLAYGGGYGCSRGIVEEVIY